MKVKIDSNKLIKPLYHGTIPRTSGYVPLSVFDKVTFNQHIAVIYAYRPPTQSNGAIELGLRRALAVYREWAGRLGKDSSGNLIILLNDEGVRFVEASVDHAIDQTMFLKPTPILLHLHPNVEGAAELLQVQLTRFACGSMVVGFTAHHYVADGNSTSNFLVAWGQATRRLKITPFPIKDRTIFSPRVPPKIEFEHRGAEYIANKLKKTYPFIDYNTDDVVIHKVHYPAEFISELKAKASYTNGNVTKRFTTIESLVAHIWRSLTSARGLNESETTKVRISVDGRSRLNPKVPNEYFGNLVLWAFATTKVKDLIHQPLSYAAKLLHEAVVKVNDDYFKSFIDFSNHEEELVPNSDSDEMIMWPNLEVHSWLRFPFYDLDFGHGEPYIFAPTFLPVEGMIVILPSFSGDGSIQVSVPLFQQNLSAFKQICYSLD